jgi:ATP adenylyltransferase
MDDSATREKLERLWAPWRIEYIRASKDADRCVLCTAPTLPDGPDNLVLHRGTWNFVILNRYPYSPGHLMVAPYKHTADLADLSGEAGSEHLDFVRLCVNALADATRADGFNVGLNLGRVAGAGLDKHLHTHIVPRWLGDSNFMPVIGDTRVLSEGLASMYAKLRKAIEDRLSGPDAKAQAGG